MNKKTYKIVSSLVIVPFIGGLAWAGYSVPEETVTFMMCGIVVGASWGASLVS
jgi:hypothetical protein